MSYGHAERNLATVRVLYAETIRLLADRQELTPDEKQWLDEVTAQPAAYGRQVGRADDAGCAPVAEQINASRMPRRMSDTRSIG